MIKANPVEMRKTLEIVDGMRKAGIKFVPMPVLSEDDHELLVRTLNKRLDIINDILDETLNGA